MSKSSEDTRIQTEYNAWKKNSPFSYDFIISHPLPHTSLTLHCSTMFPRPHPQEPSLALHRLLFGTNYYSTDPSSSFLSIADVPIPALDDDPTISIIPKVEVTQNLVLDSELEMARFMPQNPNIVCARTSSNNVFVFSCDKPQGDEFEPDLTLTGFDDDVRGHGGAGLAWHPKREGYIVSSNGHTIAWWDILAMDTTYRKEIVPTHVYYYHLEFEKLIRDVQWNRKNENLLGAVDSEGELVIWDIRTNEIQHFVKAHDSHEVNYLSFHPYKEWLLATASSDATIGLFDMRKLKNRIHTLEGHTKKVCKVEWNINEESVLASSGHDRRVIIWDINRIGDEISRRESKAKRPPELLFSHEGHKDKVTDFSWCDLEPWVISSVARDHTLQVWKLSESIHGEDDGNDAIDD
ncbi:Guanine nucleotide-binding protein, beta subunit [Trema orientale]|uniref:Guanine nucleotide-binding protein, beta subunit n=1 Tax=Trema orientale TaxID=63057 RepID=A0A2P5EWR2_TREOI|nr:Guanine nucleotide-binding protein, beta subunit [Trema orientale]